MKKLILLMAIISTQVGAKNYLDENLKILNWNGIDVVWIEDNSLPTFDVIFYFDQGSIYDSKSKAGTTELMFSELTSGTKRFNQSEIVESLEFFGVNYGSRVTHEFSSFAVSGLQKNFNPAMKLVCHVFNQAHFPKSELKKSKRRIEASVKGLVSNHGGLADHIFRAESMRGSGYEIPTTGNLRSLKRIRSKDLKQRLKQLNKSAYKRIYMRGNSQLTQLKSIIDNDCEWKQGEKQKNLPKVTKLAKPMIYLAAVPNANQAQVRVGRVMLTSEVGTSNYELKNFTSKFLGGGFSSRLVQSLRVEKSLTYSAGAYISEQRNYGRIGIVSFTRNETIIPLLEGIKQVIEKNGQEIEKDLFTLSLNNVKGNYLLGLESTSDFLKNLLYFDHMGKDYSDIYKFSDKMDSYSSQDLAKSVADNFRWDKQTVVIVGDKSLKEVLESADYKVKLVEYQDYL